MPPLENFSDAETYHFFPKRPSNARLEPPSQPKHQQNLPINQCSQPRTDGAARQPLTQWRRRSNILHHNLLL